VVNATSHKWCGVRISSYLRIHNLKEKMNFYEYIAKTNPMGSKMVIQQFGYRVVDGKRMGENLRMLVAQEGEPALRAIAELHPDKDLILEVFAPKDGDCGCKKKGESFLGADGTLASAVLGNNQQQQQQSDSTKLAMQTNAMLIAATIIIAAAIIVNKK
jgi:hypothetical protein